MRFSVTPLVFRFPFLFAARYNRHTHTRPSVRRAMAHSTSIISGKLITAPKPSVTVYYTGYDARMYFYDTDGSLVHGTIQRAYTNHHGAIVIVVEWNSNNASRYYHSYVYWNRVINRRTGNIPAENSDLPSMFSPSTLISDVTYKHHLIGPTAATLRSGVSMAASTKPLGSAMLVLANDLIHHVEPHAIITETLILDAIERLQLTRLRNFNTRAFNELELIDLLELKNDDSALQPIEQMIDAILAVYFTYDSSNIKTTEKRRWLIAIAAKTGKLKSLRVLLELWRTPDPRVISDALSFAISHRRLDVIHFLIDLHGADARDWKALRTAVNSNSIEVVELLIAHGANIDSDDFDPVSYSAEYGYSTMLRYFMEKSARPRQALLDEALISAAYSTTFEPDSIVRIIVFLLSEGADRTQVDMTCVEDATIRHALLSIPHVHAK